MPGQPRLPDLPVTFRPVRTRAVLLSIGTVMLAFFAVIAVLLPYDGARPWQTTDRVTLVGVGLLIFGVLALLSRPRVTADTDGVTVVNVVTGRRLEWAEILQVNLRPGDPWVYLGLADGTTLAAMGIQPGGGRAQAARDARKLRELVNTRGTGSGAW